MGTKAVPPYERMLPRLSPEPNSGCWLWTGNCNHKGYGQVGLGAHSMVATHRVAFEHEHGPIPKGMQVLHKCDTPCCCNPDHLWLGTHQDNIDDKMRKGRHVAGRSTKSRGSRNGNSKLTEEQVRHIRRRETEVAGYVALYGVSKTTIWDIQKGKTWGHLNA